MVTPHAPPSSGEPKRVVPAESPLSEEFRFRAFFERAGEAMAVIDSAGIFREINFAFAHLIGLPREELHGREFHEFLTAYRAASAGTSAHFERTLETFGDLRLQRPDGRVRILEYTATHDVVPGLHLLFLRDVTEKRVNDKIRCDAERELKSVLDNVDAVISRYDRDLRFIYTNAAMKRVAGIEPHLVIGKRLDELPFPEGEVPDWNANLRYVIETGLPLVRETFTSTNAVGCQYFESSLVPEFDHDGRVVSVLTISRNISRRKSEEEMRVRLSEDLRQLTADLTSSREELRHQTAVFQLVVDQMAEGVTIALPSGEIVYVNRAAREVFPSDSYPLEEWARGYGVFLPDGTTQYPVADLPLTRALKGECVDCTMLFVRNSVSGQTYWLRVTARPIFDDEGNLRCAAAVFRDLTASCEAERKLAQASTDIRRKAEQLERSNADLEQFAYVASHDLKEPLRMVTSYVQLLERRYRSSLDDDARQFIDFAVDGARRMYTLLDELLRYYRAGKHDRNLVVVESAELVSQVTHELTHLIEESGAQITNGHLPMVLGDPPQLRLLFYNLIENSIKYRASEPPRIRVEAKRDREEWQFTIADNGVGIDTQPPERVFAIFQRLHRRDQKAGTGIGLAICRRIVLRHGGRIWFDSTLGQGTSFHFTLPAVP